MTTKPNDLVWTTKSGKTLNVRNMSNQHLCNTLRLIKKKAREAQFTLTVNCEATGVDSEYYRALTWLDFAPPVTRAMLGEIARRIIANPLDEDNKFLKEMLR